MRGRHCAELSALMLNPACWAPTRGENVADSNPNLAFLQMARLVSPSTDCGELVCCRMGGRHPIKGCHVNHQPVVANPSSLRRVT